MSTVAFGGSRALNSEGLQLCQQVAQKLAARNNEITVGCAAGADNACLSTLLSDIAIARTNVQVFAVGGPEGNGFPTTTGYNQVKRAADNGIPVTWWAGGKQSLPLQQRLAARSRACVQQAQSAVFVVGSPESRGSFGAATYAASMGLAVFVMSIGFPARSLPMIGHGQWVLSNAASETFDYPCLRWLNDQPANI